MLRGYTALTLCFSVIGTYVDHVSFRGSVLFPVGFQFSDVSGFNRTLSEVSACSWDQDDDNGVRVTLVNDKGAIIKAEINVTNGWLSDGDVQIKDWFPLSRNGAAWLDSEGVAFTSLGTDQDVNASGMGQMYISTEKSPGGSPLDVAAFEMVPVLNE